MNQQQHLSDAEIEQYGETDASGATAEDRRTRIEAHLADCSACRERVLASQRVRLALLAASPVTTAQDADRRNPGQGGPGPTGQSQAGPRGTAQAPRSPDCLDDDDLRHLAAGLVPPEQATKLIQHASQCDHCGPLLRAYMEDFSDELSNEDEAVLGKLKSASSGWQKKLAREMASGGGSSAATSKKPFPWQWVLAPAALAVCTVIAFAVWYQRRDTPEKVEKLLAQAYTEQRTIEMRWPDAAWAPVRVTRGVEDSRFSKPASLLEAEGIIGREQRATPANVEWLQAQAAADILEHDPQAAVVQLNRALEIHPDSDPVMLKLAIAYFQLAQISGDPQNYGRAIDLLSKVLKNEPDNPVALFNRALVLDKLFLYDREIPDWEHYLRVANGEAWSHEARQNLDAVRTKIQQKDKAFLVEPPQRLAANQNPDLYLERYFEVALNTWLPEVIRKPHTIAGRMEDLRLLAARLDHTYGDSWLSDFLPVMNDARASPAVEALTNAIRENAAGNTETARVHSQTAIRAFLRLHNNAGLLLSKFEEAYSLGRSGRADACARNIGAVGENIPRQYRWLRIQFGIQEAICQGSLGNLGLASDIISGALRELEGARYDTLYLRALGIAASIETAKGNGKAAWTLNLQGLSVYWDGNFPPERAYQFYDGLSYSADNAGWHYVVLEIARQAVKTISRSENKPTEAMARYQLGKSALVLGLQDEAQSQFQAADLLFSSAGNAGNSAIYRIDGQLSLAQIDLDSRRLDSAQSRLDAVAPSVGKLSNYTVLLQFNREFGELALVKGDFSDANVRFRDAARFGENGLASLGNEADRVTFDRDVRAVYRDLVDLTLNQLHQPEEALSLWEWYKAAPFRAADANTQHPGARPMRFVDYRVPVSPTHLSQPIRPLADHLTSQTVVTFAELPATVVVFVWDDRGIKHMPLAISKKELESSVRQFIAECSDPSSDLGVVQLHARDLYRSLLKPVQPFLDPDRLLIVELDGVLTKLPIEALMDEDGTYVNDHFRLVVSPSILFTASIRKPVEATQAWNVLAVGVSSSSAHPELSSIPDAPAEAQMVAKHFRYAKVLTDSDATSTNIFAALPNVELLHFATHTSTVGSTVGLVVNDHPGGRGLIDGSQLDGKVLRKCKLVVLSACRTEGHTELGFLDENSLIRPFLRAGVPQVIASRWPIDSETTTEFMTVFYSNLTAGESTASALQHSAQEIRKGLHTQHPFYWAAFSLFGNENSSQ